MSDIISAIIDAIFKNIKAFKKFCINNDPVDIYIEIINYDYWKLIKKICIIIILILIYIYLGGNRK